MENQATDLLDQFEEREIIYASFWERLLALIVDGLVFSPLAIIKLAIDGETGIQVFTILTSLIGLVYKPLMEFKYGATLGKMAVKIVVVNKQYQAPSLSNVLLRNIFEIAQDLISLVMIVLSFAGIALYSSKGLGGFNSFQDGLSFYSWFSVIPVLIVIVEIILLLTDDRNRALHDRIGETFVIKR